MSCCRDHICQRQSRLHLDSVCCCRLRSGSRSGVLGLFLQKLTDSPLIALQAETRAELEDYQAAAAAYEKALQLAPSIDLLQGLAGSYVTANQQEKAVEAVQAMQQRVSGDAEQADKYRDTGT